MRYSLWVSSNDGNAEIIAESEKKNSYKVMAKYFYK